MLVASISWLLGHNDGAPQQWRIYTDISARQDPHFVTKGDAVSHRDEQTRPDKQAATAEPAEAAE